MQVAIVDYGSGNLKSVSKAFQRAALEADVDAVIEVTSDADRIRLADRIVLPGVGAYADCRAGLDAISGMAETLKEKVQEGDTPFFGICVGMQLMAQRGLEKATTPGLGWIEGDVVAMEPKDTSLKIPQIGWNTLSVTKKHPLLEGIALGPDGLHAYFVHSYHFDVHNREDVLATTDYGMSVTAMVAKDNMVGTQFHPEKSQTLGLEMIKNFLRWQP